MPDGKDILREWQDAMQLIAGAARGATGRAELPKALLAPMQRQLELLRRSSSASRCSRPTFSGACSTRWTAS